MEGGEAILDKSKGSCGHIMASFDSHGRCAAATRDLE